MTELQEMMNMLGRRDEIETNVDIVFVIDATRSMEPMIEKVKDATLTFHEDLYTALKECKRVINNLRVKVIWFRDFYFDGQYAYGESRFYELPAEKQDFHDFVAGIEAKGGYDDPESSLEALTMAMRSDFVTEGERKRHIIILFTDEEAHRFEDYEKLTNEAAKFGIKPEMYPENMFRDIGEFYNAWSGNRSYQEALGAGTGGTKLDLYGRRLVLCAPDGYPWTDMEIDLENVLRITVEKGGSGEDLDMSEVYPMIAMSMSRN